MTQALHNKTVKMGMALGAIITVCLFIIFYNLVPQFASEVITTERIKLAIMCLVFPCAFFLTTIIRVGSQRFGNPSEDPTQSQAHSQAMKVDLRVLSNTHEQLMIFVINTLALSVLLPYQYLTLLPIYAGMFVMGRIIFWLAYQHNVLWRAPGFAMSTLPAVVGIGYNCIAILFTTLMV
ncbi:MAPEG family protein [Pseudoalteromonas mariniglutinosa]|uniref:MAPEG family protein n=1 Tax=Pseudoalteromonas mariniglutinosa TaxID=206042 RepID=UPI00384BA463